MSSINELQILCRPSQCNCIELAKRLKIALKELDLTQHELAMRVGIKRSTLTNYLRLLTLPEDIQEALIQGAISMGHAKAILSASSEKDQRLMVENILRKGMSVRESEKAVVNKIPENNDDFHLFLKPLIEELQRKLGTRVAIADHDGKGQIMIDYYDWEDLDRLLAMLTNHTER